MRRMIKLVSAMLFIGGIALVSGCGDDDGPSALTVVSIIAEGTDLESGDQVEVDLNGAAAATDVPTDAVITITFSKDVDPATATSSNISISSGSDAVAADVAASGAEVTVTPQEPLARGTELTLSIGGVKAADGGAFASTTRSFTVAGRADVVPPHADAQVAYWRFDGDDTDALGEFDADSRVSVTYTTDRFGQTESTASFDGDETIIEVPNGDQLLDTQDFTLSFWMKSNSSDVNDNGETRGQFVMGLAGWFGFQFEIAPNYQNLKLAAQYAKSDGTTGSQDLWWSTNGDLGWQGWTYDQDVSGAGGLAAIVKDKWAHVVVTYNAGTKVGAIYINGELRKSQDFNLYGETHPMYLVTGMAYAGNPAPGNKLAFGFIQGSENRAIADDWANPVDTPDNNHFKGELDDVRIFHAAFTADDVADLYDAEKP